MNPQIERALKKQRLQFKSAALRREITRDFDALAPAFRIADRVATGIAWLRAHPQVVLGAAAAVAVARPRAAWRWTRRALIAWQAWRRLRGGGG